MGGVVLRGHGSAAYVAMGGVKARETAASHSIRRIRDWLVSTSTDQTSLFRMTIFAGSFTTVQAQRRQSPSSRRQMISTDLNRGSATLWRSVPSVNLQRRLSPSGRVSYASKATRAARHRIKLRIY